MKKFVYSSPYNPLYYNMSELDKKLAFCRECKRKQFLPESGIVCSLDGNKPSFEGDTCPNFDGDVEQVREIPDGKGRIAGFLWFYLFVVVTGGVLTLLAGFATFDISDYFNSWILAAADLFSLVFYAALCFYVNHAFVKRMPNAVALAKTQIITLVIINGIALLFSGGFADFSDYYSSSFADRLSNPLRLAFSIIMAIVFFVYLCTSERVRTIIPPEKRRFLKWDWVFIFGAVGVWLTLMVVGLVNLFM